MIVMMMMMNTVVRWEVTRKIQLFVEDDTAWHHGKSMVVVGWVGEFSRRKPPCGSSLLYSSLACTLVLKDWDLGI